MTDGELWSFFRALISQGTYIQMDYYGGKYKCYEEFSARLDAAARERVDEFLHGRQDPPLGMEAHMAERAAQETRARPIEHTAAHDCACRDCVAAETKSEPAIRVDGCGNFLEIENVGSGPLIVHGDETVTLQPGDTWPI